MTDTLIAILSIFMGIAGALVLGLLKKKYTLGGIGNTISGIFGSIFFIKIFGKLGFDPMTVMRTGELNGVLFITNMTVSFIGGAVGLIGIKLIKNKLNR